MTREEALLMLEELKQEVSDCISHRSLIEVKSKVTKAHLDSGKLPPALKETLEASYDELQLEELENRRSQLVAELTINSLEAALVEGVDPRYDTLH